MLSRYTFSKKRIALLIVGAVVFVPLLIWGGLEMAKIRKPSQNQREVVQYKDPVLSDDQEESIWTTYRNEKYAYQIKYPADWHIFTEEADTDFFAMRSDDGQAMKQGGAVFWSNKDNINYTEESKPEDFRLLGLLIYEKLDTDLNQYANFLGFNDETGVQSIPFKADNLVGKEFFSIGTTEKEPRSAVIFKKENRFFVFHLGFIGENAQTLKIMEEIVGSFHLAE